MISSLQFVGRKLSIFERIDRLRRRSRSAKEDAPYSSDALRYVPHDLGHLAGATKFTRRELCLLYKEFKQLCPAGSIDEKRFRELFGRFFPPNSSTYAAHVFRNIRSSSGSDCIRFQDLVVTLSSLCRGTLEEKLRWTFSLYDIDGNGLVTREEISEIVRSIYALMGSLSERVSEAKISKKTDAFLQRFKLAEDGALTEREFISACLQDEDITRSMTFFDTQL